MMKKIKHKIKIMILRIPFIKNFLIERNYLLEENKILKATKLKINNKITKKDYELFF